MENSVNNLIDAVKELKKSARHLKSARKMLQEMVDTSLLLSKSAFEHHILEVKDIKVDEQVQSPKDVEEVALEGEPDLDLIQEQDASGLN
jgi:hypothetical protein